MSIYSLARHSLNGEDLENYGCIPEGYEGEVQQIPRFFSKIKSKDLSVLASKYLWEMHVKYPKEDKLKRMCDQMFIDMLVNGNVSKSGFTEYNPAWVDTAKSSNSKVDRLKTRQKTMDKAGKYYYAAFYELLKEKDFKSYLAEMDRKYVSSTMRKNKKDEEDEDEIIYKKSSKKGKSDSQKDNKNQHEEINSVVIFTPKYNARYNDKLNFLREETTQEEMAIYYKEEAKRAGINLTVLDKAGRESFNTETFNKFALLNDWLIERFSNDTLSMELYNKESAEASLE